MIDILAAEVPQIQAHRFLKAIQAHSRLPKLDSMGGRVARVEFQVAQPAAKLRFADPAVAEKQDLDFRVDPLSGLEVLVMGADFIQNVFVPSAADFKGQITQLAAK